MALKNPAPNRTKRILIVEDDADLRTWLVGWATGLEPEQIHSAATVAEAREKAAGGVDLVILDIGLPDGSGVAFAEELARQRPIPLILPCSGRANDDDVLRFGQLGLGVFIRKPYTGTMLLQAIELAARYRPPLGTIAAQSVGHIGLLEAREEVRESMALQAVGLSGGNSVRAGELLDVTPQAVRKVLRELDEKSRAPERPDSEPGSG